MRLIALAALFLLCACGPLVYRIDVQQGNYITQDVASKLKPGMTKAEVKQLLGTPLLIDVFHADRWDYYFSKVEGSKAADRTRLSVFFKDDKLVRVAGDVRPAQAPAVGPTTPPAGSTAR
jgi:outer membrane protein assembly factor BamE